MNLCLQKIDIVNWFLKTQLKTILRTTSINFCHFNIRNSDLEFITLAFG